MGEKATDVAEIKDTIYTIKQMSEDERIREEACVREKMLHDKASALKYAHNQGKLRVLPKVLKRVKTEAWLRELSKARFRA